ncbi:triacylglycerol lipase [Trifolium repens]|jgi:hypothetical protein|nr:triacylglycerol lipase [Trifolium repens]
MANIGVSLISLVLFCSTASHGRKTLYTTKEISASSLIINDGICKTMVEIQGYTCEEHKVNISNIQDRLNTMCHECDDIGPLKFGGCSSLLLYTTPRTTSLSRFLAVSSLSCRLAKLSSCNHD